MSINKMTDIRLERERRRHRAPDGLVGLDALASGLGVKPAVWAGSEPNDGTGILLLGESGHRYSLHELLLAHMRMMQRNEGNE